MDAFGLTPKIFLIIFVFGHVVFATDDQLPEDEPPLPDYYAVLKLTPDASVKDIRRSFRRLALKYHPDKNSETGAEAVFKELSEAYAVLNDPEKKQEYDEALKEEMEARAAEAAAPAEAHTPPEPKTAAPEPTPPDQNPPREQEPEQEAPTPTQQDGWAEESHLTDEEVAFRGLDELDEETLLRMLTFLASNEFVISKRVSMKTQSSDDTFDNAYHRDRRSTPFESDRPLYSEPLWTDRPLHSAPQREYEAHEWSDQPRPRYSSRSSDPWRSSSFGEDERSGRLACRTSVRWEGKVKVTSTTCDL